MARTRAPASNGGAARSGGARAQRAPEHGGAHASGRGRPKAARAPRVHPSKADRAQRPGTGTDDRPVLLLGVGNILYGDEGLGVYVVHQLRRNYRVPEQLRILDGGALGWHLVPYIAEARRVVIVDAVAAEVGSIYRFRHHEIPSGVRYGKLSSHEWEVPELLWAMEMHGDLPPTRIIAMGVDPAELRLDRLAMGLSPAIELRLPALELVLLAELADAGILLEPRTRPIGVPDADDLVTAGREPHHA